MEYFVFRGIDRLGARELRESLTASHRTFVRQPAQVTMLHGGPLYGLEGETIGTCLILQAASRSAVEAWIGACPFYQAGLFATVSLERWGWTYGR